MYKKFENLIEDHIIKLPIGVYGQYGPNGNSVTTRSYLYVIVDKLNILVDSKKLDIDDEKKQRLKEFAEKLNVSEYSDQLEKDLINFLSEFESTI